VQQQVGRNQRQTTYEYRYVLAESTFRCRRMSSFLWIRHDRTSCHGHIYSLPGYRTPSHLLTSLERWLRKVKVRSRRLNSVIQTTKLVSYTNIV